MSFLDILSLLYSILSNISEFHKFMKNILVKFLGMIKGGIQSTKVLGNSHWLLEFPSPRFSLASLPTILNSSIVAAIA